MTSEPCVARVSHFDFHWQLGREHLSQCNDIRESSLRLPASQIVVFKRDLVQLTG